MTSKIKLMFILLGGLVAFTVAASIEHQSPESAAVKSPHASGDVEDKSKELTKDVDTESDAFGHFRAGGHGGVKDSSKESKESSEETAHVQPTWQAPSRVQRAAGNATVPGSLSRPSRGANSTVPGSLSRPSRGANSTVPGSISRPSRGANSTVPGSLSRPSRGANSTVPGSLSRPSRGANSTVPGSISRPSRGANSTVPGSLSRPSRATSNSSVPAPSSTVTGSVPLPPASSSTGNKRPVRQAPNKSPKNPNQQKQTNGGNANKNVPKPPAAPANKNNRPARAASTTPAANSTISSTVKPSTTSVVNSTSINFNRPSASVGTGSRPLPGTLGISTLGIPAGSTVINGKPSSVSVPIVNSTVSRHVRQTQDDEEDAEFEY